MSKLNVREVREARGLTHADVAKAMGITRPTYAKREHNPDKFTLEEWRTLAGILDFDPSMQALRIIDCATCNGTGKVVES